MTSTALYRHNVESSQLPRRDRCFEPASRPASAFTSEKDKVQPTSRTDHAAKLKAYLCKRKQEIDIHLDKLLPNVNTAPVSVHAAMRHSALANGKRIRPILTLTSGEALGTSSNALLPVACAMELVHAGSLIHDDLPVMDDDAMRRGVPACHRVFGEATAILAGTALLTRAFQLLATTSGDLSDRQRTCLIAELGQAVGTVDGLIGGQAVDLESEGTALDADRLAYIHERKTSALLVLSVVAGGIVAGANRNELRALRIYASNLGLAYQIVDDVLDVTASSAELGKTAGKDSVAQKATYPALYGVTESRRRAEALVQEAVEVIHSINVNAVWLEAIARFVTQRSS